MAATGGGAEEDDDDDMKEALSSLDGELLVRAAGNDDVNKIQELIQVFTIRGFNEQRLNLIKKKSANSPAIIGIHFDLFSIDCLYLHMTERCLS